MLKKLLYAMFYALPILSTVWAEEPVKLQSEEEFQEKYAVWGRHACKSNCEVFEGVRRDQNRSVDAWERRLLKFDKNKLEITSLLSEEDEKRIFDKSKGYYLDGSFSCPSGEYVAVLAGRLVDPENRRKGNRTDIWLVNVATGAARVLVADGQHNTGLSLSPDERYLGYYASDADGIDPRVEAKYGSAKVVEIATNKISVVTEPFSDKGDWCFFNGKIVWVGKNRVIFQTWSSDMSLINKHASDFYGDKVCTYAALLNLDTGEKKMIFFPKDIGPLQIVADEKRNHVFFTEGTQVLRTNLDFEDKKVVVTADEDKRVIISGIRSSGEVNCNFGKLDAVQAAWKAKKQKPK